MSHAAPQLSIAVVFATMNRAETAVHCVQALARQTRPPQQVIVADNGSEDHTVEALTSLTNLPFELKVERMPGNLGNAGAVQLSMDLAFADGADAVLILDDDSWPRDGMLEAMTSGPWNPDVVRHALQIDPATGIFTWPLQVQDGKGGWKLAWADKDLPEGERFPTRIAWTGAMIPKEIRDEVGPVMGELFIRGEDEEYPWRIENAGFTTEAVRGAVMDHPGPANLVHWRLFGKHFFFEKGLADWKLYYKVRNMVWLKRKQSGNRKAIPMAFSYFCAAVLIDGPQRVPLLCRAISDGWRGRLGKM